jgi:glycosyltransferase involved in cell wall biosynthesis
VAERPAGPGRRLVYVGRFAQGKGIEGLIEAFAAASHPGDVLTLVGDGPTRPVVEATVDRLGLSERVVLTGAVVDPASLLAGADALVLPSYSEGMPNAALEALAIGTPVIATSDLTTLTGLADRVGQSAVRLVPRAELGAALAAVEPLGAGPRPCLLPEEHLPAEVAGRLLEIVRGGPQPTIEGDRNPLRILLPMLAPYPSALASTVQSVNMAQALGGLGHEVRLVAANHDPTLLTVAGATDPTALYGFTPTFRTEVLSKDVRRGQSYRHALRLARIARRWEADLIVSRDLRGCLIPALRGTPTVLEVHSLSTFEGTQDRWVLRRLLRARGFRGFIAISTALAEDLAQAHGIRRADILVAHDAVRPLPVSPARRRAQSDPLRVGYTGSLFAGRGVELLVEVVARAPWLELHLVGGPASAADGWRERLRDCEGGWRIVVHGMVGPARARALQQEVDVLVAPFGRQVITDSGVDTSRWMSPMKVFEYMASGRPMVTSDLPVLREVLRPEVDALMVEPEDPDALLSALERLRDDHGLGARLSASAMARAQAEFTWETRARSVLEHFVSSRAAARGA